VCTIALAVTYSCTKENNDDNDKVDFNISQQTAESIATATTKQKIEYKTYHLKAIGNWVSNHYQEVQSFIDLINTGKSDYFSVSANYVLSNIKYNKSDYNLTKSLIAFENLDGEYWYPTLTFVAPKSRIHALHKSTDNSAKPIIGIEDFEDGEQIYRGYTENEINELELHYEQLSEEEHSDREIVVVDLGQCGEPSTFISDAPDDEFSQCDLNASDTGNDDSGNTQPSTFRLRIDRMTVKQNKEGWPGRSEVHFKGFKLSQLPQDSGYCGENIAGTSNCHNPDGKRISRIKRRHIGDDRQYGYLMKEDNSFNNSDFVFYRIFESDSWPAPKKAKLEDYDKHFYFPNEEYRIIEYRSWQEEYDSQLLSQDYNNPHGLPFANNFSTNTNAIKYNLTRGF
jgi:hypothetical protein